MDPPNGVAICTESTKRSGTATPLLTAGKQLLPWAGVLHKPIFYILADKYEAFAATYISNRGSLLETRSLLQNALISN